ncbi:polysaccharide deacetylase family protein, PEP-CTERM locus subfamily [Nitrosomonas eutropha]|uniref:Polysaccharide deacetylase family protein, PEP-CTERM locus subfamily n=1 Tax=Nitrosomonas eutropha TaxID=916 RepID=A0A1I7GTK6_9PROT|nr:XrtA system polysaccharide deacetylase [Nitrosomonas eutropha]SFU51775.1 polysaccharide deacetylase family protein, PEP-CTERM locus subfamily [Nitrosomonas eutropha]
MIRNALTIDVEDYFQVSAFAQHISRSSWDNLPCRVERNIDRILVLLDEHKIKATFFTLGWIAERYPSMIKRIVENGHELASHGYAHHRVTELNREQFYNDIAHSKALLEDIGNQSVWGYRAPSFSINGDNLWALECLEEAGYRYSSSVYPVKHDHYGMPDAPRFAFSPENAPRLLELPVTTVRLFGRNFPAGGGGYFRLFPYAISRWFLQRVNMIDLQPAIFYFHPWEIDPDQPRQTEISFRTHFRHYLNLGRMEKRLNALIRHFEWGRMDQIFLQRTM